MSISNNLSAFLLKQGDAARFYLINHHALWGFTYKNWSKHLAPLKDEAKKGKKIAFFPQGNSTVPYV